MRTHPIVEYYQALRDSAPCLSRAATLPKGTKLGLGKRRAPGNTIILSQPYRRRVSTDRLNREGSQLAASLEGEPGPTPAGKTLPHSFPETAGFGGSGHECVEAYMSLQSDVIVIRVLEGIVTPAVARLRTSRRSKIQSSIFCSKSNREFGFKCYVEFCWYQIVETRSHKTMFLVKKIILTVFVYRFPLQ